MSKIQVPKTDLINKSHWSHYLFFLEPVAGFKVKGVRVDTHLKNLIIFLTKSSFPWSKNQFVLNSNYYLYNHRIHKVVALDLQNPVDQTEDTVENFESQFENFQNNNDVTIVVKSETSTPDDYSDIVDKLQSKVHSLAPELQEYAKHKIEETELLVAQMCKERQVRSRRSYIIFSRKYNDRKADDSANEFNTYFKDMMEYLDSSIYSTNLLQGTKLKQFIINHIS